MNFQVRSLFKIWISAVIFPLIMAGIMTSCATAYVPVGDWARPSDLQLNSSSLNDVKVAVRCGRLSPRGAVQSRSFKVCPMLKKAMKDIGAVIIEDEEKGKADFILAYVELGESEGDVSGYSAIAYAMTAYIIPFVSSTPVRAELRLMDSRGIQIDHSELRVEQVDMFGWGALLTLGGYSERAQKADIGRRFFVFARNLVVSHSRHLKIAATKAGT